MHDAEESIEWVVHECVAGIGSFLGWEVRGVFGRCSVEVRVGDGGWGAGRRP